MPVRRFQGGWMVALGAAVVLSVLFLSGCASRGNTTPSPELVSSGWSNPSALAPVADFDAYVGSVTHELRKHRVPFDSSMADTELSLVAPFRVAASAECKSATPRGIAILIHGLSDTAFAMRDLANSFSRQCFEARALLLPGHGTRAADLMVVDHNDWLTHVRAAVLQAHRENDFVVIAGFSLGAAIALAVAAEAPDVVDAVVGLSPAYRIRSPFAARQARWIASFRPWLTAGPRAEFARYSAMPTRGIASTMAVLDTMDAQISSLGSLRTPWLLVQSEDDEVVDVAENRRFFDANAADDRSMMVNYFSGQPKPVTSQRVTWLAAANAPLRVVGISHLAVHIAPENPHYGVTGSYRNCGSTPFRQADEIRSCQQAERVWYGVGGQLPPPGEAGARATFNPHYPDLERRLGEFLTTVKLSR